MAGWHRPIYKQLAESELGRGHTSGPVIGREREYFRLEPGESRSIRVRFFVDGETHSKFTANAHYYDYETHDQVNVTGNIYPELREAGAQAGDYLAIWRSDDPGTYLFELLQPGSDRHPRLVEALPHDAPVNGRTDFPPPGGAPAAPAPKLEEAASDAALGVLELRETGPDAGYVGQGFESDAERREAIDRRAMAVATEHYRQAGYEVDDVSATESFDLRCTQNEREIHVEVKGTTGDGSSVFLTRGEVGHARASGEEYEAQLCVVSGIAFIDEDGPRATGGELAVFTEWQPEDPNLTPISYSYQVPGDADE